jgi:hypothetical protein
MTSFTKDPDAVLDYRWDWTAWLADGEAISTSVVLAPAGITLDSDTNDTTSTTAWLSGGTNGTDYDVVNRISTNQGRTDDRTMRIHVMQR